MSENVNKYYNKLYDYRNEWGMGCLEVEGVEQSDGNGVSSKSREIIQANCFIRPANQRQQPNGKQ
jgi:hypothetical protein